MTESGLTLSEANKIRENFKHLIGRQYGKHVPSIAEIVDIVIYDIANEAAVREAYLGKKPLPKYDLKSTPENRYGLLLVISYKHSALTDSVIVFRHFDDYAREHELDQASLISK